MEAWSEGNNNGIIFHSGEYRDVAPFHAIDTLCIRFTTRDFEGKYTFYSGTSFSREYGNDELL